MGVTTELPRRDGEKDATIPGEHEPGGMEEVRKRYGAGKDYVTVVQFSSECNNLDILLHSHYHLCVAIPTHSTIHEDGCGAGAWAWHKHR